MCTAVSCHFLNKSYFGRNLDYEYSFGENVIIIPRNFIFEFKKESVNACHYAIIGIGIEKDNYPLMFDCMNEYGLAFAGLNFPDNAVYKTFKEGKINLTPYEFPLWILGKYKTVQEIKTVLNNINLLDIPFYDEYPITPLHFIFSDKSESVVCEFTDNGMNIYENKFNILTNNPVFPVMAQEMNKYIGLSAKNPAPDHEKNIKCESNGMGSIGLPGDFSSRSRFVRAVFNLENMVKNDNNIDNITQFFHLLDSVYQYEGCVITENGGFEKTLYSSCLDLDSGNLYYTTYRNFQIVCVGLNQKNKNGNKLVCKPLINEQTILYQN